MKLKCKATCGFHVPSQRQRPLPSPFADVDWPGLAVFLRYADPDGIHLADRLLHFGFAAEWIQAITREYQNVLMVEDEEDVSVGSMVGVSTPDFIQAFERDSGVSVVALLAGRGDELPGGIELAQHPAVSMNGEPAHAGTCRKQPGIGIASVRHGHSREKRIRE